MTEFEERYVRDHEEWLRLVERADGVYSHHGFMAFNPSAPPSSPRRLITDQSVVEKAVEELAREFGWGEKFAGVAGPLTTEEAIFEKRYGEEPRYVGTESRAIEGGWWFRLATGCKRVGPQGCAPLPPEAAREAAASPGDAP